MFQRTDVIRVVEHRLVVAAGLGLRLFFETCGLVLGVVEVHHDDAVEFFDLVGLEVLCEDLEGHHPVECGIGRLVDDAHAASGDLFDDAIAPRG